MALTYTNKQDPKTTALNNKKSTKAFAGGFQSTPKTQPFAGGFKSSNLTIPDGGMSKMPADAKLTFSGSTPKSTVTSQVTPQTTQPTNTGGSQYSGLLSQLNSMKSQYGGGATLQDISGQNQPTKTTTTPTTNNETKGSLYGNTIQDLLGSSKPNNTQTNLVKQLQDQAMRNAEIASRARGIAEGYGQQIADVGKLGAGAVAGNLSTGSNVVGTGNANLAAMSANARMDALAKASQAALEGTGQELTGQQQTTDALNQALSGANVQQSTQLGGLSSAGGLAQPVQVAPGSTLFSPIGGDPVAGGLGGYVNYQTAEQVMGLISQYPDAGYSYNPALTPQQNLAMAQQAIQGSPTYQRSTFGAPGASSYLGGAQLQTAADLTGTVNELQAVASGAEANFDLLLNIAERGGVNNLNQPALNQLTNNLQKGLASDADVASFQSVLQSVQSQYANILGGGTTTVESLQEAQRLIPSTISLSALQKLRGDLESEVHNRVAGYQNQIQSLLGSQGGGGFAEVW